MNTKTDFRNNTYIDDNINISEIDDDYIEDLKEELHSTAQKIKNNEFEAECEDCTGCPYRKICKK